MQHWNPYACSPVSVWEQHEGGCSANRGRPKAEDNTEAGNAAALMKRAKYLNEESRAGLVTGTMNGWTWPSDYQSSLQCSDRPGTRSESQVCGLEAESGRYEQSYLQHDSGTEPWWQPELTSWSREEGKGSPKQLLIYLLKALNVSQLVLSPGRQIPEMGEDHPGNSQLSWKLTDLVHFGVWTHSMLAWRLGNWSDVAEFWMYGYCLDVCISYRTS